MTFEFTELDYRETPLGAISLRRRSEPRLDNRLVYEVKLGDEFLMSSLFTESEKQLATLALRDRQAPGQYVVVGGLGLGYTAAEALNYDVVGALHVVEVMGPVIEWHRQGLVPLGETLTGDARCRLVEADFFAIANDPRAGFDVDDPHRQVDVLLLDIDHSPQHWLNESNASLYSTEGLQRLASKLAPSGCFGLWSNDPPDRLFQERLATAFARQETHQVAFPNPYQGGESSCTVYLAWR